MSTSRHYSASCWWIYYYDKGKRVGLVIVWVAFELADRRSTYRTFGRRFFSGMYISADQTVPFGFCFLREFRSGCQTFEQSVVAFLVLDFHFGHQTEFCCYHRKAFLFGYFCEVSV